MRVVSKAYGSDQAWAWESDGVEGYTIEEAQREGNGTDVILTLKDNTDEENFDQFLSEYGLKDLIKRYSNYVRYPVRMEVSKSRQKPKPEDAGDDYKPEYEQYTEVETINSMVPIWKRSKSDVTTGRVQRVLQADLPRLHRPGRARSPSTPRARCPTTRCCSSPAARRTTCTARTTRRAWSCTAPTC